MRWNLNILDLIQHFSNSWIKTNLDKPLLWSRPAIGYQHFGANVDRVRGEWAREKTLYLIFATYCVLFLNIFFISYCLITFTDLILEIIKGTFNLEFFLKIKIIIKRLKLQTNFDNPSLLLEYRGVADIWEFSVLKLQ